MRIWFIVSMSGYTKYQHLEKFGSSEVDGILMGECYVFPKIDGTNAQVWHDGENIRCGSRRREITIENDNAGFCAWVTGDSDDAKELRALAVHLSGSRIFGEWLVPHSLKTYRPEAWRKFYIFDIVTENGKHLHFDDVSNHVEGRQVNLIHPIQIIQNPALENIEKCLPKNTFLIGDGDGVGEGVVVKNYEFTNQYGRQVWAKLVTTEFKEKHVREMGAPKTSGTAMIEESIVEEFLTPEMINKAHANIVSAEGGWQSKFIPRLLGVCFYDLVRENIWSAIKKGRNPTIDFKALNRFASIRVKKVMPELF